MSESPSLYGRKHRPAGFLIFVGFFCLVAVSLWLMQGPGDSGSQEPATPTEGLTGSTSNPRATENTPALRAESGVPAVGAVAPVQEAPILSAGGSATDDLVADAREKVSTAESKGDPAQLRRLLGVYVLDRRLPSDLRIPWMAKLDDLNRRLVFSSSKISGFGTEAIRKGDSYWEISRRLRKERGLRVTAGFLEAINQVATSRLRQGDNVKVPEEVLSLLVDRGEFRVFLLLGGVATLWFPVGIGRDDQTPEGEFVIGGKMSKPVWTDPKSGKTYKHGEPGHLIGSRWLAFYSDDKKTRFGIHGTIDPESVGKAQSDGCVRLRNEDVERLFDLVPEGAAVVIR